MKKMRTLEEKIEWIVIKNENLEEPFCYEDIDEEGEWYGIGEFDEDKIIPGWIGLEVESGLIYWLGDKKYPKFIDLPPLTDDSRHIDKIIDEREAIVVFEDETFREAVERDKKERGL